MRVIPEKHTGDFVLAVPVRFSLADNVRYVRLMFDGLFEHTLRFAACAVSSLPIHEDELRRDERNH